MKPSDSHRKVFVLFLAIISIAFLWVLLPFYGTVFWALVLSVIFMPLNDYFLRKLPGRKNIAAFITLFICLLIVVIPLILVFISLAEESADIYHKMQSHSINLGRALDLVLSWMPDGLVNLLNNIITTEELQEKVSSSMLYASQYIAGKIFVIGQNILDFVIGFCIMLYLLFYLFRDGRELGAKIRRIIPLPDSHKTLLLAKFTATIRATIKGSLVVAVIQGATGAAMFWALGVGAALLWGALMAVLALLPAGSGVVWIPVAIYFLSTGSVVKGIVLLAFGVIVIGVFENLLKPILVGKDAQLPDYLVLISTFGGIALLGLNGFVIGPVVASLFITGWELYAAIKRAPFRPHEHDSDKDSSPPRFEA